MTELVVIKICADRIEAEVVKGMLESHGVYTVVSADDAGGMRPYPFQYVTGAEVKVRKQDVQKAKTLLRTPPTWS